VDKKKTLNVTPMHKAVSGTTVCRHWYATPSGQITLERLRYVLARMTADVFGYYALECGALAGWQGFLQESRIASRFSLASQPAEAVSLVGAVEHLPFAFNNLDLVVASHALDCSANPHQVLREIERVLVAEGHCIIVGFNPFSLRGIGQLRHWLLRESMPCRTYTTFRVREWLNVLGFEVLETVSIGFCPLFGNERHFRHAPWLGKALNWLRAGLGNVYVIHAQKKVSNMTPLPAPPRKAVPVLRPGMVANPGAGRLSRKETGYDQQDR
jgi:SAM-dependent methyltransferase